MPPPVVTADTAATIENTPISIDVLENDTNSSGGAVAITGVTQPAHGTVTVHPGANSALQVVNGQTINAGAVLAQERDQAWTIMTSLNVTGNPAAAAVIASNLTGVEGYSVARTGLLLPLAPRTVRAMLTVTFGPKN